MVDELVDLDGVTGVLGGIVIQMQPPEFEARLDRRHDPWTNGRLREQPHPRRLSRTRLPERMCRAPCARQRIAYSKTAGASDRPRRHKSHRDAAAKWPRREVHPHGGNHRHGRAMRYARPVGIIRRRCSHGDYSGRHPANSRGEEGRARQPLGKLRDQLDRFDGRGRIDRPHGDKQVARAGPAFIRDAEGRTSWPPLDGPPSTPACAPIQPSWHLCPHPRSSISGRSCTATPCPCRCRRPGGRRRHPS